MNKNTLLLAIVLSLVSVASCAYELRFYLTFIGTSSSNVTGVTNARAQSLRAATYLDNTFGMTSDEHRLLGPTAVWVSVFDKSVPSEVGNITFANAPAHVINFKLLESKAVGSWDSRVHSAGYYNVTGGLGAFAGADGIIAFSASLDTNNENAFFHRVTGSLWIQGNPPPPASIED